MGLLSFIKNAGAKLFGHKEIEAAPEAEKAHLKASALLAHVQSHNLPFNTLIVKLNNDNSVTISGEVDQQVDAEKIALTVGNVEGVESVDNNMTVAVPAPDSRYHTVVAGDWLSKIAQTY
jgi:LysM repeat protein